MYINAALLLQAGASAHGGITVRENHRYVCRTEALPCNTSCFHVLPTSFSGVGQALRLPDGPCCAEWQAGRMCGTGVLRGTSHHESIALQSQEGDRLTG